MASPSSQKHQRPAKRAASADQSASTDSATALPPPRQSVARPGPRLPVAHGVEQGREHPRAAGADRMAERDGAAVHVDPVPVPAQRAAVGQRLHREGLVGLDEVVVADRGAGLLQQILAPPGSARRRDPCGSPPPVAYAGDARHRREPVGLGERERGHDQGAGAVVEPRRVAGGDAAVLLEGRLELGERLDAWCPCAGPRPARTGSVPPFPGTSTGTISAANLPASIAATALRWLW